uniref:Uncharacterized protein n=1 Tax=Rhizophora mucronata TaxID=61149 RepID=A0A2P2PCN9_RHIMU
MGKRQSRAKNGKIIPINFCTLNYWLPIQSLIQSKHLNSN